MIHASVGGAMKNATNWWPRITSAVLLLLISSSPDLAFAFDPQESAPNQAQQKSPKTQLLSRKTKIRKLPPQRPISL